MNGSLRGPHVSFRARPVILPLVSYQMEDNVSNPPGAKGLSGADEIPASRIQETGREQRRKAMARLEKEDGGWKSAILCLD